MDTYLLRAAVLYVLSATSHTSVVLDEFSQDAPLPQADLDPLTCEVFDMRSPLERLGDSELVIPRQLQQPILTIVRACGDALSRIDDWVDRLSNERKGGDNLCWIHEMNGSLRTCRGTLQLAVEAVNLAAVDEDGANETTPTYLDQDTSRVLALIRRTLQQFQQADEADDLKQPLRSSLDQIRIFIQIGCRSREDTRGGQAQAGGMEATTAGPAEKRGESSKSTSGSTGVRAMSLPQGRHGPGNKLASVLARWSLGSPRRTNISTPSSTRESLTRPSSALSTTLSQMPGDDTASVASSAAQTSRQTSQLSRSSVSSVMSSRGSKLVAPAPSLSPHGLPSAPPKWNARGSRLPSMDESARGIETSPPTPATTFPGSSAAFDQTSISESFISHSSRRATSVGTAPQLPLFAISPPDKIVINPSDIPEYPSRHTRAAVGPEIDIVRTNLLSHKEKGEGHGVTVYFVEMSPARYILASKHGDKTLRVYGLPQGNVQASLRINFYLQMRERSRDFFVTSHAILSETRSIIAVSTGFGDTLEIWNWALRKKLQVIENVYRWAAAKADIYESKFGPLACYREAENAIYLYPVTDNNPNGSVSTSPKKKLFGDPVVINLKGTGLRHTPKLPELAYSSTAALLVAAAGPRPPRTGHPPPDHAAILMVWELEPDPAGQSSRPWRLSMPERYKQLETALPCGLATHGNFVVSIWIPHNVRVIGRPRAWQVEPVEVHERHVLVWNFQTDATTLFPIPNENTIACISPDCRYVAYRQGPGADTEQGRDVGLVVLDALEGGRELWRTPTLGGGTGVVRDCEQLMDLSKVTSISFSPDGTQLIVGDTGGSAGVYDVNVDGRKQVYSQC